MLPAAGFSLLVPGRKQGISYQKPVASGQRPEGFTHTIREVFRVFKPDVRKLIEGGFYEHDR
jgi:hypothetical protein